MKQFVYPAVLYKDSENRGYTIVLNDLNIITEGTSVEDAFLRAKDFLEAYCNTVADCEQELEEATKYEDVETEKDNIVLLVDAIYEGEKDVIQKKFSLNL